MYYHTKYSQFWWICRLFLIEVCDKHLDLRNQLFYFFFFFFINEEIETQQDWVTNIISRELYIKYINPEFFLLSHIF